MKKLINYIAIFVTIMFMIITFVTRILRLVSPTFHEKYYQFVDKYGGLKIHNVILGIFLLACMIHSLRIYLKYKNAKKQVK